MKRYLRNNYYTKNDILISSNAEDNIIKEYRLWIDKNAKGDVIEEFDHCYFCIVFRFALNKDAEAFWRKYS